MTTVTCSNRVVKLSTASRSVRLLARAIGLGEAIRVDARFLMAAMTFTGVSLELMRISDQPLDVLHQVLPIQDDRQDVEMAVIALQYYRTLGRQSTVSRIGDLARIAPNRMTPR